MIALSRRDFITLGTALRTVADSCLIWLADREKPRKARSFLQYSTVSRNFTESRGQQAQRGRTAKRSREAPGVAGVTLFLLGNTRGLLSDYRTFTSRLFANQESLPPLTNS